MQTYNFSSRTGDRWYDWYNCTIFHDMRIIGPFEQIYLLWHALTFKSMLLLKALLVNQAEVRNINLKNIREILLNSLAQISL